MSAAQSRRLLQLVFFADRCFVSVPLLKSSKTVIRVPMLPTLRMAGGATAVPRDYSTCFPSTTKPVEGSNLETVPGSIGCLFSTP